MRIAVIAPPWLPVPARAYGGTEAVIDTLGRGLARAGEEVLLCTTGDSTIPVERQPVVARSLGTQPTSTDTELRYVVEAYRRAIAWDPDVVHDHTLLGPAIGSLHRLPLVATNHGPFEGPLTDYYRALAPRVAIVAISHHHASTAGIDDVTVIHHGVDVDAFPLGSGAGGYALFLGRMSPDKGVREAVDVARAAGVRIVIASKLQEPAEHEYFDAQVAPSLGPGVEFVGEVGGEDKLDLLAEAACLLNPLRWAEPFGMVMVEALACGTPVVAAHAGSVPEIVEDGVTGFVRDEPDELVDALGRVHELDRPTCRRAVEDRFTSDRMVADYRSLFRRVSKQGSSNGARTDAVSPG